MTSLRHSVRGISSPRSAYRGSPTCENSLSSSSGGGGTSNERRQSMNCSSPYCLERLLLVLALERAVVALVEPPRPAHRDPVPVGRVEGEVRGVDRAPLHGGVHDVGEQPGLTHQLAAALGLGAALLGQVDVDPAGEEVLGVPVALAVAEQDQGVGHGRLRSVVRADQCSVAGTSGSHCSASGGPSRPSKSPQFVTTGIVHLDLAAVAELHQHLDEVAGGEVAGDRDRLLRRSARLTRPPGGISIGSNSVDRQRVGLHALERRRTSRAPRCRCWTRTR